MEIRADKFEQEINLMMYKLLRFYKSWKSMNSLMFVRMRKEANNFNQIFYDCHSPYNTDKSNPQVTEFIIHCPMYGIDWRVECKSQQELSNLNLRVLLDVYQTKLLPEKEYCVILKGDGFVSKKLLYIIDDLSTRLGIVGKIWVGTPEQFKSKLISQIKRYS